MLTHYLSVPMQHPGVMPNRMMMVPGMGQVIVGQQGQILPQGIEIFKNSLIMIILLYKVLFFLTLKISKSIMNFFFYHFEKYFQFMIINEEVIELFTPPPPPRL